MRLAPSTGMAGFKVVVATGMTFALAVACMGEPSERDVASEPSAGSGGGGAGPAQSGAGSTAGGSAGSPGSGGVGGCAAICISRANLRTPMPVDVEQALAGMLEVCRNDECYTGALSQDDLQWAHLESITEPQVSVRIVDDDLHLDWFFPVNQDGVDGDRYRLRFDETVVIDEVVSYEPTVICGDACGVAVRHIPAANGGAGGEGGASGSAGAPEIAGAGGEPSGGAPG